MTARGRLALVYAGLAVTSFIAFAAMLIWLTFPPLVTDAPKLDKAPSGKPTVVAVAEKANVLDAKNEARRELRRRLMAAAAGGIAVMTAVSAGLGWLLAGRVLRPVHAVSATARRLSERDLHERIPVSGPHDEMRELAETINSMLARLEGAFGAQQRFAANASHELRGPITTLRALVDVAAADPDATPDLRELAAQLAGQFERQQRLVDGLLTLASSEHGPVMLAEVPLEPLVRRSIAAVAAEASARRLSVAVRCHGDASVNGDDVLLRTLVDNLIRNAVRHNVDGGRVLVTLAKATLTVTNTGPVVAPDRLPALTEPFRRGADDRVGTGGAGLGLAIAEAVARSHDAELTLAAPSTGGLSVTVTFPAPLSS